MIADNAELELKPLQLLIARVQNPDEIVRVHQFCKRIHTVYPEKSAALFVHFVLWLSGIPVPYSAAPHSLIEHLFRGGWQNVPPDGRARPGDVYFTGIHGEPPVGCGLVVKGNVRVGEGAFFLGINSHCTDGEPKRIYIEGVFDPPTFVYPVIHVLTAY